MLELANDLTAQGLFVVLNTTFAQKAFRGELINWAKNTKFILNFVQCSAPESVLIQRLKIVRMTFLMQLKICCHLRNLALIRSVMMKNYL